MPFLHGTIFFVSTTPLLSVVISLNATSNSRALRGHSEQLQYRIVEAAQACDFGDDGECDLPSWFFLGAMAVAASRYDGSRRADNDRNAAVHRITPHAATMLATRLFVHGMGGVSPPQAERSS